MSKILGLVLAAMLVMALVGGATFAAFSDTETSTSNTMSVGTLDLRTAPDIGGTYGNGGTVTFTASGLKPDDAVITTGHLALKNTGSLNASILKVATGAVSASLTAAGSAVATGDLPGGDPTAAYLSANTRIALFVDMDDSGTWSATDIGLKVVTGTATVYTNGGSDTLVYDTFDNMDGLTWTTGTTLNAGIEKVVYAKAYLPTAADNRAQGTQLSIDLTFEIDQ